MYIHPSCRMVVIDGDLIYELIVSQFLAFQVKHKASQIII